MSTIVAVDPGTTESAVVVLVDDVPVEAAIAPNDQVLSFLGAYAGATDSTLVIERVESFGMVVSRTIFETVFWSGRFVEAWVRAEGYPWASVTRRDVKRVLCGGRMRSKDGDVRRALIARYGGERATKRGGALFGITSHKWAAVAVAVTFQENGQHGNFQCGVEQGFDRQPAYRGRRGSGRVC